MSHHPKDAMRSGYPLDETVAEHLRNAIQLLHNLRTFEMSSMEAVRHESSLDALYDRIMAALAKVDRR